MRQAQALYVMTEGRSVFLTGAAGSGKTFVLNQFIERLKKQRKKAAITASTGIAATHIGGTTIHSWSGLGIRDSLSDQDRVWLKNNDRLSKRYNSTDVLIIDEASMLHGKRLDMVNEACKLLRRSDAPFGGLQVVLTGDLFQLPPVNREGGPDDFIHQSAAWEELDPKICYLSEQHRQEGDELLELLSAMRGETLGERHHEILNERMGLEPDTDMALTRLYAHNVDVEAINDQHLQALDGESRVYEMATSGRAKNIEQLQKSVLAPEILELKHGAEVMFVANNFPQGFVNGSRGQVVDFDGDTPIVELQKGRRRIAVEPHTWTLIEDGRERARVEQLPLRLAWAITIHKSQGMSLDSALIDLGRSFTYGMGYVALSRVRSLDGLYLSGINHVALQLHPDIYAFDASLRQASELLSQEIGEVPEVKPEAEMDQSIEYSLDNELYDRLTAWRLKRAREQGMPAYIIAHNKALEVLATEKPRSESDLLGCHGIGRKFVETYGPEILELIAPFAPEKPPEEPETAGREEPLTQSSDYQAGREAIIVRYPRAFQRWQPEEDARLRQLINESVSLDVVCQTLQRQPSGVWARAIRLLDGNSDKLNLEQ